MMKRSLCLLLAVLTALSLCVPALADEGEPAPAAESPAPAEEPAAETPAPTEEPAEETPAPTEEPAEETPAPTEEPVEETPAPAEEPAEETPAPTEKPVEETPAPAEEPAEDVPEPISEPAPAAEAANGYRQTLARQLAEMVNTLRTTDAWYWKQDPPTGVQDPYDSKYYYKGTLSALTIDADLEAKAMELAKTVAENGGSSQLSSGRVGVFGPVTVQAAFDELANEGGTADGQQKRRVMLSDGVTAMGAGCYVHNGQYAWVLVFGGSSGKPLPAPEDSADGIVASGPGWKLEDSGLLTVTGIGPMPDYGMTETYPDAGDPGLDREDPKHSQAETSGSMPPWSQYAADIGEIKVEQGVTAIGTYAFASCWNVKKVTLPAGVTSIGDNAFNWCGALTDITLPAGLQTIGLNAFASCSSLASIVIPEGVTSLGSAAFFGCEALQSITLPKSLTDVGSAAFGMCLNAVVFIPCRSTLESLFAADPLFDCKSVELVHTWDTGVVTKDPTCVDPGTTHYTCQASCGAARDESIAPLGHTWDNGVVITPSTSTTPGLKRYTCTRCAAIQEETLPPAKNGWYKESGYWYWYDQGLRVKNAFVDNDRCYVGPDGAMLTGWQYIGGSWYWFNSSGYKQTGWLKTGGKWYWLESDGRMATGLKTVDGQLYYLDGSGAMLTGWQCSAGRWYYFEGSGAAASGWLKLKGTWYYLDPGDHQMLTGGPFNIGGSWYTFAGNGAMKTGWQLTGGTWYWYDGSGAMARNDWRKVNGKWYWLEPDGKMAVGWKTVGGVTYYLSGSGAMVTGWQYLQDQTGGGWHWYRFDGSGAMVQSDWRKVSGKWYWMESDGKMAVGWKTVRGATYYLDGSGAMLTGWQYLGGVWYWFDGSGAMARNDWRKVGGAWYWFDSTGAMAAGQTLQIGGVTYTFGSSGALLS